MGRIEMPVTCFAFLLVGLGVAGAWPARDHLNLSGPWLFVKVKSLDWPPPSDGWSGTDVPGLLYGHNYECAWLRRSFEAPTDWRGKRVKLRLSGARYSPVVFVNGQKVGEHFGGYEPCEFDITSAIRPGESNEVVVGCHDWTGVFDGPPVEFPERISWDALRGFPRDRILYPIGGLFSAYGLWDDPLVYAVPNVYVADLAIVTKVSARTVSVTYTVANESAQAAQATLRASVMDGQRVVFSLPEKRVSVAAGGTATVSVEAQWKENQVKLWSPEQPALYFLQTTLAAAGQEDVRRDRFGFREIVVKGPDFYLNGVPRRLLASSAWPMPPRTHEEVTDFLRRMKTANIIAFRTHTQPWREIWYQVADEVGLCMIPEGAVWNDDEVYRLDDQRFWENWGRHLVGMVRALRNHPSVIMWSLENEFCGWRASAGTVYEQKLADLGRLVKREDPTRPITYESDGDPGGVADVIGLHYPNEPPGVRLWPNDAYWMDRPRYFDKTWIFLPDQNFLWDRRKPLYIGEYLWYPGGTPADYTLFCGDDAYRDLRAARNRAKAAAWRWQTVAYRHYGVSGISPWCLVEGGPVDLNQNELMAAQAWAMQPLAAYVREEIRRAYAGSTIELTLEIFNDTPQSFRGALKVAVMADGKGLAEGGMALQLPPGTHLERPVSLTLPTPLSLPRSGGRLDTTLRVTIEDGKRRVFYDERPFAIYSSPRLPALPEIFLYDPVSATARLLEAQQKPFVQVKDFGELKADQPGVLVIGEKSLDSGAGDDPWDGVGTGTRLYALVRAGWKIIVLRQDAYPGGMFPAQLASGVRSTMAFATQPSHYLLRGLPDDAFKFWAPDHIVTGGELIRPITGAGRPLVITGHPDGVSHCALLEMPRGRGAYIFCQLPLVERYNVEPMANVLLSRLLLYATLFEETCGPALVSGADEKYLQVLSEVGVRHVVAEDAGAVLDREKPAVVILRGGASATQQLLDWVRGGGNLVLDRPSDEVLSALGAAAGVGLRGERAAVLALRAEGSDELLDHILREDLYWVGPTDPTTVPWADRTLSMDVAEGNLVLDIPVEPLATFGPADMTLEGTIVERTAEEIVMATVGTARMTFTAPRDGSYVVLVEARSTPCHGVHAVAEVTVDGEPVGIVSTGMEWRRASVVTNIKAGAHEIAVSFINDASTATEDRNLLLRSVLVGEAPEAVRSLVSLATGGTAAYLRLGSGRVVVNFVRWDTDGDNASRARRYLGSLLTGLSADFDDEFGVAYDVTKFAAKPDMPYFRAEGGVAQFASNGWVEGEIQVPRDGRYKICLNASGTPAKGVFPQVRVWVDGQAIDTVTLTTGGWKRYPVFLELTAGSHILRLEFTNDFYEPPEDRNLNLGQVFVTRVD
ncbi:MAG: hypothetical protein N2512_15315 [Armatimonadetes bacterium]|nr:hypothetical protein [Armatimonadota bacterium]